MNTNFLIKEFLSNKVNYNEGIYRIISSNNLSFMVDSTYQRTPEQIKKIFERNCTWDTFYLNYETKTQAVRMMNRLIILLDLGVDLLYN